MGQYVSLEEVEELIRLYNEREIFADHTKHYDTLTNEIHAKIKRIRANAEEL